MTKKILIITACAIVGGIVIALVVALIDQNRLNGSPGTLSPSIAKIAPRFENIADQIGLTRQPPGDICSANAAGAAWINLDNKGNEELVLGSYQGDTIVWQISNKKATMVQNLGAIKSATGLSVADYNNDGFDDILVSSQVGSVLYQNFKGRLKKVEVGLLKGGLAMDGAWGDYNRDGLLDLAIAQGNNCVAGSRKIHFGKLLLYKQNKNHTFTIQKTLPTAADQSEQNRVAIPDSKPRASLGLAVAFTDLNDDGWLDLYEANDHLGSVPNQAWVNDKGSFRLGFPSTDIGINSMGIGLGDYNRDARMDLAISNIEPINLLINSVDSQFGNTELSQANSKRVAVTWGLIGEDFNNDGFEDIWSAAGGIEDAGPEYQSFYLNQTKEIGADRASFVEIGRSIGLNQLRRGRSAAYTDLNNDGLLDVALSSLNDKPSLYLNQGSPVKMNWLSVRLRGRGKSPRSACGARAWLQIGQSEWMREVSCAGEGFLSSNTLDLHFGVGLRSGPASLKVRWPSGKEAVYPVKLDRLYKLTEAPDISFNK